MAWTMMPTSKTPQSSSKAQSSDKTLDTVLGPRAFKWSLHALRKSVKDEITQFFNSTKRKRERSPGPSKGHDGLAEMAISSRDAKRCHKSPEFTQIPELPESTRLDVLVFGCSDDGELGLGAHIQRQEGCPAVAKRPRLNSLLGAERIGVVQVAVGGRHCAALTHQGHVLTWGANELGALGRTTTSDATQMAVSRDATCLNPPESLPCPVEGLSNLASDIIKVAATDHATFILTRAGLVYGWGTFVGSDGVYGFLRGASRKPRGHRQNGVKFQTKPVQIDGLKNIRELSAGMNHVLALTESGDVLAWGSGQQAQLGRRLVQRHQHESLYPRVVDLPRKGIVKVFAGRNHSFALDVAGRVWAWGLNNFGQTGIPATNDNLHVGSPTVVEGLLKYKLRQIAGGFHHSLACTEDGRVLAWGRCDQAQMGMHLEALPEEQLLFDNRGKPRILLRPTVIPGIKTAKFVAAGTDDSFAIDADGSVLAWGFSDNYRTGLGTETTVETPTKLSSSQALDNTSFTFAGCGAQFTVITRPRLLENGSSSAQDVSDGEGDHVFCCQNE